MLETLGTYDFPDNPFKSAKGKKRNISIGLIGPSGSGKTKTALMLATAIGGRIAMVVTEPKSFAFAEQFEFDAMELDDATPEKIAVALEQAVKLRYDWFIVDSFSSEWYACLQMVDDIAAASQLKNNSKEPDKLNAWRTVTPMHSNLILDFLHAPINVICTIRTKTALDVSRDEKGKLKIARVPLKPVQREEVEYDFHLFGMLTKQHSVHIFNSVLDSLERKVLSLDTKVKPDAMKALADPIKEYLAIGSDVIIPAETEGIDEPATKGAPLAKPANVLASPVTSKAEEPAMGKALKEELGAIEVDLNTDKPKDAAGMSNKSFEIFERIMTAEEFLQTHKVKGFLNKKQVDATRTKYMGATVPVQCSEKQLADYLDYLNNVADTIPE